MLAQVLAALDALDDSRVSALTRHSYATPSPHHPAPCPVTPVLPCTPRGRQTVRKLSKLSLVIVFENRAQAKQRAM